MSLAETVEKIAAEVRERETVRRKMSESLRAMKSSEEVSDSGETIFVRMRKKENLAGMKMAGVDGGMLTIACHGMDLLVTRAVGVIFSYSGEGLASCDYFPESSPTPGILNLPEAHDGDLRLMGGLYRTLTEIECALECAKKFSPQYLILHGPVGPHLSTKPEKNSPAMETYEKLNRAYLALYQHCEDNKILLLGVVEDSRGRRFSEVISKSLLPVSGGIRDTALLFDALDYGERTFAFKYAVNPAAHPVLSDLGKWAQKLYSFYAKTAECDRPIRVDFLASSADGDVDVGAKTKQTDEIAAALFSMSGWNRMYGLPPVLIEADCRARLREEDGKFIRELISDKVGGPLALDLRREGRPF